MKNREIKFRAWDKEEKKMYYNVGIAPDGMPFLEADYPEESPHWLQNAISLQFTGLLDKNGKEIFEGDIVRMCNWIGGEKWEHKNDDIDVVRYKKGMFRTKKDWDNNHYCIGENLEGGIEIIGNIFLNKDLLK